MISLNGAEGDKILKSKKKSFCFVAYLISLNEKNYWDGLVKNNPEFIKKLWHKMFGNVKDIIYFFHDDLANTKLVAISIESWTIITNNSEIKKQLPIPNNDWKIEEKNKSQHPTMYKKNSGLSTKNESKKLK